MSSLRPALIAACGCMWLAGCESEQKPLRVVRVQPAVPESGPLRIPVNQEITVHFSEPIDPFTVTEDTFRVTGGPGDLGVPGTLHPGTRSVTFRPVPPVTASLGDGSFRPGSQYRLQISGFPRPNRIRSTLGTHLEEQFTLSLEVSDDPAELGLPTAFLPVGIGTTPLMLDAGPERRLSLSAETRTLRMYFTLPLHPQSVRPAAFQFTRIDGKRLESLVPAAVRVLGQVDGTAYFGSTVEIVFDESAAIGVKDGIWVTLAEGDDALRDYRGRSVIVTQPLQLHIESGVRDLGEIGLIDDLEEPLGFEWRNGRLVPRCRVEAGDGSLGWFRPTASMSLQHGVRFDRGDGQLVKADQDFHFLGIDIPAGVEVRIRGPISLLACGSIRIAGELIVEGDRTEILWKPGERVRADQLLKGSVTKLVAGGDIVVSGSVEHANRAGVGTPITFVSGADVRILGRVSAQAAFGIEPEHRLLGAVESPLQFAVTMTPGLPDGVSLRAGAWTEWLPLGPWSPETLDAVVVGERGPVDVAIQVAPPHPVDASRPHDDGRVLMQPVEIGRSGPPIDVPNGGFVRFRVQAEVGEAIPSLRRIVLRER